MIRLLIVDNEKHIVQGLSELFLKQEELELDVICAYSPQEVLQWLPRVKLDIVLSDIRMPGMSGLELQQLIREQWPHCKVIFLSGYGDFEYARTAIQNGGFDYLLKMDGDDKVIEAVKKAASLLSKEQQIEQFIEDAKEQFHTSLPVLRKDFFLQLLDGHNLSYRTLPKRFEELDIHLNPNAPVIIVLGRVDHWQENVTAKDQALLLYAVRNISEEYLIGCSLYFVAYDRSRFVLFIQPKWDEGGPVSSEASQQSVRFILSMMENIQDSSKALLKLTLSFVKGHRPYEWVQVPEKFNNLKNLMIWGLGYGNEMLITDETYDLSAPAPAVSPKQQPSSLLIPVEAMRLHLENGNKPEFFNLFSGFFGSIGEDHSNYFLLTEMYQSISLLFLTYLNRMNLAEFMAPQIDIHKLTRLDVHETWDSAVQYLRETAELLFAKQKVKQEEQKSHIVQRINHYIEDHLGDDLSLTKLAETVYLNPSYLCRLYKQISGQGLSDFINEARFNKAKQLLEQSNLKIHEIAPMVGFESKSYFARFFRNKTNLSPQEYRDMLLHKQVNERR